MLINIIEIEDISFWMNKFYPMKIKTILNLRRIIKSFDCYISCLIADSFTVYIPQLTTPIFQLLITHHSCVGYHFMEEGLAYYKDQLYKASPNKFPLLVELLFKVYNIFCRRVQLNYPFLKPYKKSRFQPKYYLLNNKYNVLRENVSLVSWIKEETFFTSIPSGASVLVLSPIVEYRLATPEKFYASMNLLFNYISDSHVFIKAHPYQASSVVNTLVGLLEQHGKTWTLIPNDEPFEQILLSVENLCVFGTESSLMFYATLLGNNNKIISNRNNLAFNDIIFRKYAQNSESLVVNSYIQI